MLLHLLTTMAVAGLSRNQKAAQADAAMSTSPVAEATAAQTAQGFVPHPESSAGADGQGRTGTDAHRAAAASSGVGNAEGLESSYGVSIPQGSSPLAAAGRELRQLVSFGGRMSYTEGERTLRCCVLCSQAVHSGTPAA